MERQKIAPPSSSVHSWSLNLMHPNSLENLKKGAESRRSGKERHHYTLLPEHHAWLASGGNACVRLGEVIGKILAGELIGYQHLRKAEAEIERLKKLLAEKEKNT